MQIKDAGVKSKFKCALIAGAGAVENAWSPVQTVFQAYAKTLHLDLESEDLNYILANEVYRTEFCYLYAKNKKEQLRHFDSVKQQIAESIKDAEASRVIYARPFVLEALKKFTVGHLCNVISTNWDKCLESSLKHSLWRGCSFDCVLYLHGNYDDPKTLYLPSEKIDEPYRSKNESAALLKRHKIFWNSLVDVQRIILCGISLSVLDAELTNTLFSAAMNGNVRELFIIDSNPDPVARRLTILFNDYSKIEIVGFKPDKLSEEINY